MVTILLTICDSIRLSSLFFSSRERYLTAATYLSSRAFPSTLMSKNPSVSASRDSYPVLFPGVDSLNHGRGRPVSWIIAPTNPDPDSGQHLGLSLTIHSSSRPGEELLNNYGAKPNSELILGYGFSLEGNPDDTIVLSISGGHAASDSSPEEKERWEVGRNARGVQGVWNYVLATISSTSCLEEAEEPEVTRLENQLDAANMLSEMCRSYLDRLPKTLNQSPQECRTEVLTMLAHYIEGKRSFNAIVDFVKTPRAFRPAGHPAVNGKICRREGERSRGRDSKAGHRTRIRMKYAISMV